MARDAPDGSRHVELVFEDDEKVVQLYRVR